MPKRISDSQIAAFAKQAGVKGDNLAIAVAVALAESGGDTESHNPIPPDDSYGLWQINFFGGLARERKAWFGVTNLFALYDPALNAKYMYRLSNGGTNWTAWTTYTSGKYRVYLARGKVAAQNAGEPVGQYPFTPDNPNTSALTNLGKAIGTLSDPEMWTRIAMFLIGFMLSLYAFMKMTGASGQIATAAKTVTKAVITKKVI
jgi:hypothetical protein